MSKRGNSEGSLFKRSGSAWAMAFYNEHGRRVERSTRTSDRAAAARILAKVVADVALRRSGVIDSRAVAMADHGKRPIGEHVAAFEADMTARGGTSRHVRETIAAIRRVIDAGEISRLADLRTETVRRVVADMRKDQTDDKGKVVKRGVSVGRVNHILRATKSFSRWCWRTKRQGDDALVDLSLANAEADRRRVRRALDADELGKVIDAAQHGDDFSGMTGPDRAMLYRLAAGTGFRAGELRSLTRRSFDLMANPPVVVVEGSHSKRRREDRQPIRHDLADMLASWLSTRPADGPVFAMPDRLAEMLRHDLDAAGVPYEDDAGRVIDFHALRATYITALVRGGATVKQAQTLARHSDPKLTMNVYTKLGVNDIAQALDALPASLAVMPTIMSATGTDDVSPVQTPRNNLRNSLRNEGAKPSDSARHGALRMATDADDQVNGNPLFSAGKREETRPGATENENTPGAIRTHDLRIRSPLTPSKNTGENALFQSDLRNSLRNGNDAAPCEPVRNTAPTDPDLVRITEAWPNLPKAIRRAVLSLINTDD